LRRLVDLSTLGWPPITATPDGLEIAATCTIAELNEAVLPPDWIAARLIGQCCEALWASFKVWNTATVGGNICLALPAGAMIALTAALDGVATIWLPDGQDRRMPVIDLVTGPNRNALAPGQVLRGIAIEAQALRRRAAFRQISLTRHGRSGALLIGTRPSERDDFALTLTGSTPRPVRLNFSGLPTNDALAAAIDQAVPNGAWYDDMHGKPDWRRHVTLLLAEEIRQELAP
jgi:CO/xanthine dehydrogenase FAD-binding subunit